MEKIKHDEKRIIEIEVNEKGDKIYIPMDDARFYDKFLEMFNNIISSAEAINGRINEIEKEYAGKEDFESKWQRCKKISAENVAFSNCAVEMVEMVFGKDALKKYFADVYEKIPDYLPDTDGFMDFLEKITPVIDKMFGKKTQRKIIDKSKMSKYQPQSFGK